MLFNTFPFLVFFVVVFFLYWKIPKKFQWVVLLIASYYFYGSWRPGFLGLIAVTTLINYFSAIAIHDSKKHKKRFLILGLLFNLGTLFIFKYFNFFSLTLNQMFTFLNWNLSLPQVSLPLPIGISFYTFQVIGYLVDVFRGTVKPEKHIGTFALFICFFPQLLAGPIERARELLPQLKKLHTFQYGRIAEGLQLFTFGLFKKMVIADNLAVVVNHALSSYTDYKGLSLIITFFLYTWQIYMDFSGYTDMARGVARMIGIDLVENFHRPYLSTSVRDFWRRWHMSLSRWIRDYIYIPLGGSRNGLGRTCLNILIVFTLCGLWHGAAWNFILWGAFHGIVMSLERFIGKGTAFRPPKVIQIIYAYIMVSISWIFFRSQYPADAMYVFRYAFVGFKNFISPSYVWATVSQLFTTNTVEMIITAGIVGTAVLLEIIPRISLKKFVNNQPTIVRFVIYVLVITLIFQLRDIQIKEFIYVRF